MFNKKSSKLGIEPLKYNKESRSKKPFEVFLGDIISVSQACSA